MKKILTPFIWIIRIYKKIRRRIVLAKAYTKLKRSYEVQLQHRKRLRSDINKFLKEYFGINAKSKFIPPNFRNKEEVKLAVLDKFGTRMEDLNIHYTDLFK